MKYTLSFKLKGFVFGLAMVISLFCIPAAAHAELGDVNKDGNVDLRDVILSLQVSTEIPPADAVYVDNDVNGDFRIGLEEAVFAMKSMAPEGSAEVVFPTGNGQFTVADGQASDTMSDFRSSSFSSNLLPSSADHSDGLPDIRNQGNIGSCTAWATGYYYKTLQEYREEGWDRNQHAFSPMYLFSMQCKKHGEPYHMIKSWEILNRYGCAKLSAAPYEDFYEDSFEYDEKAEQRRYSDFASSISGNVHTEAAKYKSGEMNQLSSLQEVKQALTAGPVILGIHHYSSDHATDRWNPSSETNFLLKDPSYNGSHAILCVGYDDGKFGSGAIRFVNSWGQDWAIDGYSWIKYDDYDDIIMFAMTIKDVPNPNDADETVNRPDAPTNVSASDEAGPYVDITWDKVDTAQYYTVHRAAIRNDGNADSHGYEELGIGYINSYRDYPEPGKAFYYAVVAVNDIGASVLRGSDTDVAPHVDKGSAKGESMLEPRLGWLSNTDGESNFTVSNIDPNAQAMEVLVSTASEGPWDSFGWVNPEDFGITWGDDSEYVGKRPYVKVRMSGPDGFSEPSEAAQVRDAIVSSFDMANIESVTATANEDSISVSWKTDGGDADAFNIWRYRASEDQANEWISVHVASGSEQSYDDVTALPGIAYYYAVSSVYQGADSEPVITDEPVKIKLENTQNLYLYNADYEYGQVSNPVSFSLSVWNDGGTVINDYSVSIRAYDWDEGEEYLLFDSFRASDVLKEGQLPLNPDMEHTLSLDLEIPSAYADGHYYSWVIEIDAGNEIDEAYEDDNIQWSFDGWWAEPGSLDPNWSAPNLSLYDVYYDAWDVSNPVRFDLEVWNDGTETVNDYAVSILVYDWDDDKTYQIFDIFNASDAAGDWHYPLEPGDSQTLSFDFDIPEVYADNHFYSWIVRIDPENAIHESDEDDNEFQADELWWADPETLNGTSASLPNLRLSDIPSYPSGQLTNPVVDIAIDVANDGDVLFSGDCVVSVGVYDWDESESYSLERFHVTGMYLDVGTSEIRTLQVTIPSYFADSHQYSWEITLDPDDEIVELYEFDNSLRTELTWFADYLGEKRHSSDSQSLKNAHLLKENSARPANKPGTSKESAPARIAAKKASDQKQKSVRAKQTRESGDTSLPSDKMQQVSQSARNVNKAEMSVGSTRPFSKKRIRKKGIRSMKREAYIGPIRYRKPSFCNNHTE